jgi:pSer/pThr/pTyr-binding forkhead associated (FHA) protein
LVSLTDGREYLLDTIPFVIGRDAGSSVVIEADEVLPRHAELLSVPEGLCLLDRSSGGVWVNGEQTRGRTILKSGDVIRIAGEELRYYPAEARVPTGASFRLGDTVMGLPAIRRPPMVQAAYLAPSEPPLASLLIQDGQRQGERIAVRTPVVNIGRADYNDLSLPDSSVSASHARLQLREGVWMVADLGSTNGTRVNGVPVEGKAAIASGSRITFGEVTVSFELPDTGVAKGTDTKVLQVPLADSAPVGPGPQGSVVGGFRRNPAPQSSAGRTSLIVLGVGVVFLITAYFLLG